MKPMTVQWRLEKDQDYQRRFTCTMSNRGSQPRCHHTCDEQRQHVQRLPLFCHMYHSSVYDNSMYEDCHCLMKAAFVHMTIATIPCTTAVCRRGHRLLSFASFSTLPVFLSPIVVKQFQSRFGNECWWLPNQLVFKTGLIAMIKMAAVAVG